MKTKLSRTHIASAYAGFAANPYAAGVDLFTEAASEEAATENPSMKAIGIYLQAAQVEATLAAAWETRTLHKTLERQQQPDTVVDAAPEEKKSAAPYIEPVEARELNPGDVVMVPMQVILDKTEHTVVRFSPVDRRIHTDTKGAFVFRNLGSQVVLDRLTAKEGK